MATSQASDSLPHILPLGDKTSIPFITSEATAMPKLKFDLGLSLDETHVLITGGAGMIGRHVVTAFLAAGARVSILDINDVRLDHLHLCLQRLRLPDSALYTVLTCDISSESSVENAFATAYKKYGPVQVCVALASLDLSVLPHHASIADMDFAQWRRTFDVNVHGTFLTARAWLRQLKTHREKNPLHELRLGPDNVSLIIIGSESGTFGVTGNADYAAGKSAVQGGLLQSLKAEAPRIWPGARVNAVAPGAVDTPLFKRECKADPGQYYVDAQATVPLARPVSMESVARTIVFLASETWSGDIHGQVLAVDGGKSGRIMWEEGEFEAKERAWAEANLSSSDSELIRIRAKHGDGDVDEVME